MAQPALAQQADDRDAIVVIVDGVSFPDLLAVAELRALASHGGTALMNGRADLRETFPATFFPAPERSVGRLPFTYIDLATAPPSEAAHVVADELAGVDGPTLALVIAASPSAATAEDGDEVGTVIAAWGDPAELLEATGEPNALTSDSTRRAGVVADVDPAATVAEWLDLPYEAGAPIEPTDEPAPLDLYERYLQQRRLAVPAAVVAWGTMALAGVVAVGAVGLRRRLPGGALWAAGFLPAALPWLALALLLAGHLSSLTAATVIPFVLAIVVVGVVFTRWVARRSGIYVAQAACGAVILAALGIEAATGWQAAVTPLAGGGQLDGGRFFGMPNIEIGIVLGSALFVAHRLRVRTGVLLLILCGLAAGSPWTGSNMGAAITLFAAAGLWLALRHRWAWWAAVFVTGVVTAAGVAAVGAMHRYLSERPTHISTALASASSPLDLLERVLDRLRIGVQLLADSPAASIPVLGTLVLLVVVLRPPAPIARSFEGHDAWRDAILAIVLGSIVAYLANDTGAAALGFGFGFALSGLIDVSLATARGKMAR